MNTINQEQSGVGSPELGDYLALALRLKIKNQADQVVSYSS